MLQNIFIVKEEEEDDDDDDDPGFFETLGTIAIAGALLCIQYACWSDRRLKKDINKIGQYKGLNVYEFKYIWDNKIRKGFMADEVEKVIPSAVIKAKNGYSMVNYAKVIGGLS